MSPARGDCHYNGGCTARGSVHILVDDDTTSWACDEHYALAMELLKPLDHHPLGDLCHLSTELEPKMLWHMSTPEHEGFCFLTDDELRALIESHSLDLVSTSGISRDGQS